MSLKDDVLRALDLRRVAVAIVAPLEPDERDVLDQQIARLDFGDAAFGEADDHEPPAPCHHAQARVEYVAADRIDHEIDPAVADRVVTGGTGCS